MAKRNHRIKTKSNKKNDSPSTVVLIVLALPIFPGRHQPSIVGRNELNYRVRNGNGWTLTLINTNCRRSKLHILRFSLRPKLIHSVAHPLQLEPASLGFKSIRGRSMLSGQTGKQTVLYSFFSRLSSTFLDPALPNSQTSEAFADWRRKIARPG